MQAMDTQFIAIVAGFVGGVLLSFILAYWLLVLQRKRKELAYDVWSMELVRFSPAPGWPLRVTVPRWLLKPVLPGGPGDEEGARDPVEVQGAYAFEVRLRNTGNEVLVNLMVCVQLDRQAKVLRLATEPSSRSEYPIQAERDQENLNVGKVSLPYLNPGQDVRIHIVSADNTSELCEVVAFGPGVTCHRMRDIGFLKRVSSALVLLQIPLIALLVGLLVVPVLAGRELDIRPNILAAMVIAVMVASTFSTWMYTRMWRERG